MQQPLTTEKIPLRNNEFSQQISAEVRYLNRCYQCSMCSDGCPVAYAMDYYPNQLIHLVRLGLKDLVLKSTTIWLCASCETCATRCPNEIEIVRLMDILREESVKAGVNSRVSNILKFHQAFLDQIKKKGRIDEVSLMVSYELKSREFLSIPKIKELAGMAIGMYKKGKIKFPSMKKHSSGDIKSIFKKVYSR
ncbi:MAG: 4Fe-4S dicluster domain-containing protein [Dehalococcoidales bacterium]|nr:MAG: 4Fe-4S dicluster domain-containing protein [Dehalococcoidales bacterium]